MAGDFEDWYKKRQERLGKTERRYESGLFFSGQNTGSKCIETAQCSAGYACVDGTCLKINNQPGNGSPTGFGLYKKGCWRNDGDCNSGRYTCAQGPTCGRGSGRVDCCGGRITYKFEPGTESRITGKCIDNEYCNSFCSSSYALFGRVSEQCKGESICENTDCQECGLLSGICERKFGNLPCWCDGGAQCGGCKACITNPNSSNFGSCAITSETAKRCRQCVKVESHTCCGKEIGPVKKCAPPRFGGTTNDLRDALKKELQDRCRDACQGFSQLGGYEFRGVQSYHEDGQVKFREVFAAFTQGGTGVVGSRGSCRDGGCYPTMSGAFGGGAGGGWSGGVDPDPGDCTGDGAGCGMFLRDSSGTVIFTLIHTTVAGCKNLTYQRPDGSYYRAPHFGPGCTLQGTWTYVG